MKTTNQLFPLWAANLLVVLPLTLSACSKSTENKEAQPAPQAAAAALLLTQADVLTLQEEPVQLVVEMTGSFEAQLRTTLRAKASGQVLDMPKREGDQVKQGELLVRIDPTEAKLRVAERQAALAAQQAQLSQADTQFSQQERLFKQGFVSEAALVTARASREAAKAQTQVAQAQLDLALQQLRDTEVKAPYPGTLGPTQVQVGSKVSMDSALLELLDIQTLEFKAQVNPDQQQKLKLGQSVTLQAEGLEQPLTGKVLRISPAAQGAGRAVPVYITTPNPGGLIRAGQFGKATAVAQGQTKGLLVPLAAVRESKGTPMVYRINAQQQLEEAPVTLGAGQVGKANNTWVEVTEGLAAGDRVVGVNLGPLRTGVTVQIQTTAQGTLAPATQP